MTTKRARAYIAQLQARNNYALGFLPTQALAEYLERRRVIIAYENGDPCGYLLHRPRLAYDPNTDTTNPETTIIQICVQDDARRVMHATRTIQALANQIATPATHPITLWCGAELPASRFWADIGFAVVGRRLGGKTKHPLHLKWRTTAHLTDTEQIGTPTTPSTEIKIPAWYPHTKSRRTRPLTRQSENRRAPK